MKEFIVKRYRFEELDQEAQEKAVENMQRALNEWLDSREIEDYLRYQLEERIGGTADEIDIHFSLSYCQGDGVALYGKITPQEAPKLPWIEGVAYVRLVKNSWGHHYSHSNTFNVDFYDEEGEDVTPYDNEGKELPNFREFAKEIRRTCDFLEEVGYKYIESNNSEESARAYLLDNYDEVFTIDGDMSPITITDTAEMVN